MVIGRFVYTCEVDSLTRNRLLHRLEVLVHPSAAAKKRIFQLGKSSQLNSLANFYTDVLVRFRGTLNVKALYSLNTSPQSSDETFSSVY